MYGPSGLCMQSNVSIAREGVRITLIIISPDASRGLSSYDNLCRNLQHYIILTSEELITSILLMFSQGHWGVISVVAPMTYDNINRPPISGNIYFGDLLSFFPFRAGAFDGNRLSLVNKSQALSLPNVMWTESSVSYMLRALLFFRKQRDSFRCGF